MLDVNWSNFSRFPALDFPLYHFLGGLTVSPVVVTVDERIESAVGNCHPHGQELEPGLTGPTTRAFIITSKLLFGSARSYGSSKTSLLLLTLSTFVNCRFISFVKDLNGQFIVVES